MKKSLLILILSIFSTSIIYGNGDTSEYVIPPGDDNSDSNENPDENYGHRKLPIKNYISFSYDSTTNRATFSLPSGITSVSVIIESPSGEMIYGIVERSNPYLWVNLSSGLCRITCITDTGMTFQGDIEIE